MLKNKFNETRNLKIWEVLSETKKAKSGRQFQKEKEEEDVEGGIKYIFTYYIFYHNNIFKY